MGTRLQRVRAVYSVKSAFSEDGLKLTSPLFSKPISSEHMHAFSLLLSGSEKVQQRHMHTFNCSAPAMPSSFTIMLLPSSQQPTFICSVVNSLAVKLKDWLRCLSSFYLLPWFIFISTMKGRNRAASRSCYRIQRHIILCESSHCFSKTLQHYCT